MKDQPLSSLAPKMGTDCHEKKDCHDMKKDCHDGGHGGGYGGGWALFVVWFIIIVIIVWLIISFAKPDFCGKFDQHGTHTGELDSGKALLWAIVIAIIIVLFIWLILWAVWGWGGGRGGY